MALVHDGHDVETKVDMNGSYQLAQRGAIEPPKDNSWVGTIKRAIGIKPASGSKNQKSTFGFSK